MDRTKAYIIIFEEQFKYGNHYMKADNSVDFQLRRLSRNANS